MTAKERVLAVHPDAYTTYNGQLGVTEVWSTPSGGSFLGQARGRWGSEEAAWQNAAESLPAENGVSKFFGTWPGGETDGDLLGALDEIRKPTGPVTVPGEAKEKERCEHGVWLADYCYKCAEPKPTPSAAENKIQQAINLIEAADRTHHCIGRDHATMRIMKATTLLREVLFMSDKSQPDSSSIPDEHSCREVLLAKYMENPEWAARFEAECKKLALEEDSSSISTEHTFEDVLRKRAGEYQDMGSEHRKNEEYAAACCCEDKASGLYIAIKLYRSWNAAKGLK